MQPTKSMRLLQWFKSWWAVRTLALLYKSCMRRLSALSWLRRLESKIMARVKVTVPETDETETDSTAETKPTMSPPADGVLCDVCVSKAALYLSNSGLYACDACGRQRAA